MVRVNSRLSEFPSGLFIVSENKRSRLSAFCTERRLGRNGYAPLPGRKNVFHTRILRTIFVDAIQIGL